MRPVQQQPRNNCLSHEFDSSFRGLPTLFPVFHFISDRQLHALIAANNGIVLSEQCASSPTLPFLPASYTDYVCTG